MENQATGRGGYDVPGRESVLMETQVQAAPGNESLIVVPPGNADVRLDIAMEGTIDHDENRLLGAGNGVAHAFKATHAGKLRLGGVTIDPAPLGLLDVNDLSRVHVALLPDGAAVLASESATHMITPEEARVVRAALSGEVVGVSPAGEGVSASSEAPATPLPGHLHCQGGRPRGGSRGRDSVLRDHRAPWRERLGRVARHTRPPTRASGL